MEIHFIMLLRLNYFRMLQYMKNSQFFFFISGADVNFSSPVIGTPLHVACADSVPNRLEILQVIDPKGLLSVLYY